PARHQAVRTVRGNLAHHLRDQPVRGGRGDPGAPAAAARRACRAHRQRFQYPGFAGAARRPGLADLRLQASRLQRVQERAQRLDRAAGLGTARQQGARQRRPSRLRAHRHEQGRGRAGHPGRRPHQRAAGAGRRRRAQRPLLPLRGGTAVVIRTLCLAVATAVLAACAAGPDYRAPVPPEVTLRNAAEEAFAPGVAVAQWWAQFDDPVLEKLVGDALLANPDMRLAATRVRAARAVFSERRLDPWPHVGVAATGERTRQPDAAGGGIDEVYSLGFDAAWELDRFGRLRRGAEAARADLQAEQAGLEDVQVSIAAEVARNYFLLRGTQKRIEVAEQTLRNLDQTQRLTETREALGAGSALDVHSSRAQLKAIEADIPLLRSIEATARYRLAVLQGLQPGALDELLAPKPVPAFARALPLGDVRDLLRSRPDVRAAERRLASATARVGVATADLFPRISIRGFAGFLSGDFSSLV